MRLGAVRHDDHQVIAVAQQLPAADVARTEPGLDRGVEARAVVIDHLHPEAERAALRDALPDPAHAEHAERRAVDIAAGEEVDGPLGPIAAAQVMLALGDAPRRREQKREAEVGGRLVEDAGRVRERDAAFSAGGEVDVVVADRHARDGAQRRAALEHRVVDRIRARDEGAFLALQPLDHLVAGPFDVGLVGLDLEMRRETLEDLGKDAPADQDRRLHGDADQERKVAKLDTGSRSVTRLFSIAFGSATPSDMPQTSCSLSGAPSSPMMILWNCVKAACGQVSRP